MKTLRGYVLHCKLHRNEPHCLFKCQSSGCSKTFFRYGAFKAHFYRRHNMPEAVNVGAVVSTYRCPVALCEHHCQEIKNLLAHLKEHIAEGREVCCPVTGCTSVFNVKSSFTSHILRKHRDLTDSSISDMFRDFAPQSSVVATSTESADFCSQMNEVGTEVGTEEGDISENFSDLYLRNVSLFYLKLQGKFLLPASTIQNIVEEMQDIHELGQAYTLSRLRSLLKNDTSLSDDDITKVCDSVKGFDLFTECHTGPMRTIYSRNQTFKKMFHYVEPKKLLLGTDEHRQDRFAYYVPIKETLKYVLESNLWLNSSAHIREQSTESGVDVLSDISDGQIFKQKEFFNQNPSSLKLVLYQDAFEVANPLGSAKAKHKVLAVYVSVANLPPHVRSDTDHMSLVLLCRENDFKTFGHSKVFSELVSDLKELEETGILASHETVRGTLYCIAGDNLGSHCIGGFSENFSTSQYFCRYCLVTRNEFQSDNPNVCGPLRTIDKYNSAIDRLQNEDVSEGVKFDSVFNSLHHFHVCQPGLPPCLGHDIFEGILAYDVALYLKYFVKQKKWFTYSTLNRRIYQFKYCLSDASTKPCRVKPLAKKLSGQAIQNWNFLRLLPVIIGDRVKDTADDVWQLTLQLKDIVDMVCAQKISVSQVAFLDVLIQEYLESRKALFPSTTLKPKHHYLRHYPALILKFGPLIRLWTMRFESKHSYFKRCARNLKNFKNLCFTLSQRHQMLQAYLSAGSLGQGVLQVKDSSPFYVALYSQGIQDAVREFGFSEINTKVTVEMSYKGTLYKKGQFLVTGRDSVNFGELGLILIKNDTIYFIVSIYNTEFIPYFHMYSVKKDNEEMCCLNINDLADFYPLPSYWKDGYQLVPLKHGVLAQ